MSGQWLHIQDMDGPNWIAVPVHRIKTDISHGDFAVSLGRKIVSCESCNTGWCLYDLEKIAQLEARYQEHRDSQLLELQRISQGLLNGKHGSDLKALQFQWPWGGADLGELLERFLMELDPNVAYWSSSWKFHLQRVTDSKRGILSAREEIALSEYIMPLPRY